MLQCFVFGFWFLDFLNDLTSSLFMRKVMRKDYLKWWLQCYNSLFLDFLNDITSSYIMRKGYLKGLLQ